MASIVRPVRVEPTKRTIDSSNRRWLGVEEDPSLRRDGDQDDSLVVQL